MQIFHIIFLLIALHLGLFGLCLLIAKNSGELYENSYGWQETKIIIVLGSLLFPYILIIYLLATYSKPTRNICPLCQKKSTGEFAKEIDFYKRAEKIATDTKELMKLKKELFND